MASASLIPRELLIVGYGIQGRAWAHNLRDSGWKITVSGRPDGKGIAAAAAEGFATVAATELESRSEAVALLLPDLSIKNFLQRYFAGARSARSFLFAHGFGVAFCELPFLPSDDVVLVAPKGSGVKLRETYMQGSGLMGVLGVQQDASGHAWDLARAVAEALGCGRIGLVESTFLIETESDLLSEQALLCGGVPRLLEATLRLMVAKGVPLELARYECVNELKLIADMMVDLGVEGMFRNISPTARYGGMRAANKIFPAGELEQKLETLFADIHSGKFAAELQRDEESGSPEIKTGMERYKDL